MKRVSVVFGVSLICALMVLGCGQLENVGDIEYFDEEEVFLYEEEESEGSASIGARGVRLGNRRRVTSFDYRVLRVAQIQPVTVDGKDAQANDILIDGNDMFVAYNTAFDAAASDQFAGALQVVDIRLAVRPVITTEVALPEADVTALAVTSTDLYIGGAWNPDDIAGYSAPNRAFIVKIPRSELGTVTADYIKENRVILDSYVTTGIAIKDDRVFASTGADLGKLIVLDSDLEIVASADFEDVRDIETYRRGVIGLQGTFDSDLTVGRVFGADTNAAEIGSLEIADFGSEEKKASIEVYNARYGFLGLSEAGFQIVFLRAEEEDGEPVESVYTITNPTGLSWTTETDTNSVSYQDDLIFTANGEAGFRVFRVTANLDGDEVVTNFTEKIGFVPFDETDPDGDGIFWSANHVEYKSIVSTGSVRSGFLGVASGVGGVNMYYLRTR